MRAVADLSEKSGLVLYPPPLLFPFLAILRIQTPPLAHSRLFNPVWTLRRFLLLFFFGLHHLFLCKETIYALINWIHSGF